MAATAIDNRGKHFVLAFLRNVVQRKTPHNMEIFLTTTSNVPAEVTITAPRYDPSFEIKGTVNRGQITDIQIPYQLRGDCDVLGRNKALVIHASQEITVYAINKEIHSTDAFLALPADTLGTDYLASTWSWKGKPRVSTGIAVAAIDDFTEIKFSLPPDCDCIVYLNNSRYLGGDTFELTLDKYMGFLVCGRGDLTGTRITSSKPIAVFSGNDKTQVPYRIPNEFASADHLVAQLIPVKNWGKDYITFSSPDRCSGDYAKIIANENGTNVTYPGGHFLIQANQFKILWINSGDYYKISATKGIMVAMFSRTYNISLDGGDGEHGGDPSMSILVPISLYVADYTFATVSEASIDGDDFYHYLTVVIDKVKKDTLMIDNSPVSHVNWTSVIGTNDYVVAVFNVSKGAHNVYNKDTTSAFLGMASGNANYNSYAYPSGMRLAPINEECIPSVSEFDDGYDNDCDGRIDEELLNGIDDDGDGRIDEDLPIPRRVDGGWGLWSQWSACPSTCSGRQSLITRQRLCNNPPPANNGLGCEGDGTEFQNCTGPSSVVCPEDEGDILTGPVDGQWGSWSQWSACLATCSGVQSVMTRQRMCNNPSPANGGLYCVGDGTEYQHCTGPSSIMCPVDGSWGSWSPWSSCSATCKIHGIKSRQRFCNNPIPQYNGNLCLGDDFENSGCEGPITIPCPIDGSWSSWSAWSACSAACNMTGIKTRQRLCDNPTPKHNGNLCLGDEFESTDCDVPLSEACPVDGQWGSWSEWGSCSATCRDLTGLMSRKRPCNSPSPQYSNAVCDGNDTEVINCSGPAVIFCRQTLLQAREGAHWGLWTKWSNCDVTCERGIVTRSRQCLGYNEEEGIPFCTGDSVESGSFEMKYVCLPDKVGNLDIVCNGEDKQACMMAVIPCAHSLHICAEKRQCGTVVPEHLQCSGTGRLVITKFALIGIMFSHGLIMMPAFHFIYQF